MKQGIQTNFPHEVLRRWGCYFFCLAEWASRLREKDFTNEELIALFDKGREEEVLTKNCLVLNPVQLLNIMLGEQKAQSVRIVKAPPARDTYVVYLEKPGFGHFLLSNSQTIWDPLDPNRPAAKGYIPVSYREIW